MNITNEQPKVAICMATYNPNTATFQRQVDSIIAQSHNNWICIIHDDASSREHYQKIKEICHKDSRFQVFRNTQNLGFYHNFEACLKKVPAHIPFVALCDQDDEWNTNKLEKCLAAFKADTMLVYSDMRIVSENGDVLHSSYWFSRKNYYKDLELVLVANTITGAASVLRAELLPKILPFPKRIGDMFHDHWIACTALMAGSIEYVDAPLYDYYQHGSQAIGHCNFKRVKLRHRFIRLRHVLTNLRAKIIHWRASLLAVYHYEYLRLSLITSTLRERFPNANKKRRRALALFNNHFDSVFSLLRVHTKVWYHHETTDDAELRLAGSYLMNLINKVYLRLFRSRIARRIVNVVENKRAESRVLGFEAKIAPLNISLDETEPKRVNILIPEINFKHFFGGYIGKFNFVSRLLDRGYNVRFLVVDWSEQNVEAMNKWLEKYEGLQRIFQTVELTYCFERSVVVPMNPNDALVATTWWTAHIAHAGIQHLKKNRFIYFIQEYEPFTFAMGSYFALAHQSYSFPHYALFSTALLQEYFIAQKIGSTENSRFFNNAILRFEPKEAYLKTEGPKKLLFYARPEPHASRNMFEVALSALSRAIEEGVFNGDEWEFYGIGTSIADIPLPGKRVLKMIGKVDLKAYQNMMLNYDLGLSLMYTPHPSLVPLEMAAAAQIVVTNTCFNKTRARMAAISSNIIAGEPTVSGIVESLREAVDKVPDYAARIKGATVHWPSSWEETFSEELMDYIGHWL